MTASRFHGRTLRRAWHLNCSRCWRGTHGGAARDAWHPTQPALEDAAEIEDFAAPLFKAQWCCPCGWAHLIAQATAWSSTAQRGQDVNCAVVPAPAYTLSIPRVPRAIAAGDRPACRAGARRHGRSSRRWPQGTSTAWSAPATGGCAGFIDSRLPIADDVCDGSPARAGAGAAGPPGRPALGAESLLRRASTPAGAAAAGAQRGASPICVELLLRTTACGDAREQGDGLPAAAHQCAWWFCAAPWYTPLPAVPRLSCRTDGRWEMPRPQTLPRLSRPRRLHELRRDRFIMAGALCHHQQ
jgi:hypothetical protein